jgi:hypothetical protein
VRRENHALGNGDAPRLGEAPYISTEKLHCARVALRLGVDFCDHKRTVGANNLDFAVFGCLRTRAEEANPDGREIEAR